MAGPPGRRESVSRSEFDELSTTLVFLAWCSAGVLTLAGAAYGFLLHDALTGWLLAGLGVLCALFALLSPVPTGAHEHGNGNGKTKESEEEG